MDKILNNLEYLRIPDSSFFGVGYETQCAYERANDMLDKCCEVVKNTIQPIYEVLVYSHPWTLDEKTKIIDYGSEERVGFYYEKDIAIQAIKENWCSLQDHYARAAAVREVKPGLYQDPPFRTYIYFLWNSELKLWEEVAVPKEVGDFC